MPKIIKPEELKPGMVVRVHQRLTETGSKGEEKERIQVFEGTIISKRHGNEPGATITVRKESHGVGVEMILPIFSPIVDKFEVVKQLKVSRAKLYYLKDYKKKLKEF